jgi:hypothetical protein
MRLHLVMVRLCIDVAFATRYREIRWLKLQEIVS